jgi:hypothetical protein
MDKTVKTKTFNTFAAAWDWSRDNDKTREYVSPTNQAPLKWVLGYTDKQPEQTPCKSRNTVT